MPPHLRLRPRKRPPQRLRTPRPRCRFGSGNMRISPASSSTGPGWSSTASIAAAPPFRSALTSVRRSTWAGSAAVSVRWSRAQPPRWMPPARRSCSRSSPTPGYATSARAPKWWSMLSKTRQPLLRRPRLRPPPSHRPPSRHALPPAHRSRREPQLPRHRLQPQTRRCPNRRRPNRWRLPSPRPRPRPNCEPPTATPVRRPRSPPDSSLRSKRAPRSRCWCSSGPSQFRLLFSPAPGITGRCSRPAALPSSNRFQPRRDAPSSSSNRSPSPVAPRCDSKYAKTSGPPPRARVRCGGSNSRAVRRRPSIRSCRCAKPAPWRGRACCYPRTSRCGGSNCRTRR